MSASISHRSFFTMQSSNAVVAMSIFGCHTPVLYAIDSFVQWRYAQQRIWKHFWLSLLSTIILLVLAVTLLYFIIRQTDEVSPMKALYGLLSFSAILSLSIGVIYALKPNYVAQNNNIE